MRFAGNGFVAALMLITANAEKNIKRTRRRELDQYEGTWWMVATEGKDHINIHASATTKMNNIPIEYPGEYYNGANPLEDDKEAPIISICNDNNNYNNNNNSSRFLEQQGTSKIPVGLSMELELDSVVNISLSKIVRKLQVNIIRHVGDLLCSSSIHYLPPNGRRRLNDDDNILNFKVDQLVGHSLQIGKLAPFCIH